VMLKKGGRLIAETLTLLFSRSWELGYLPSGWRVANIVAIAKERSRSSGSDFRPISLLSTVGKLMEKVITRRLAYVAESKGGSLCFRVRSVVVGMPMSSWSIFLSVFMTRLRQENAA